MKLQREQRSRYVAGALAGGLGLALLGGIAKLGFDLAAWRRQMERDRAPWERS